MDNLLAGSLRPSKASPRGRTARAKPALRADHRPVGDGSWRPRWSRMLIALLALGIGAMPVGAAAHPMGNFSISHYAGITVRPNAIELHYLIDMAEIPTFQEIQDGAIVPE